jgi:large subunit ribosomal protein L23
MKTPEEIIRRMLITEKGTKLREQRQYVFEVAPHANKPEIRRAVEQLFRVHVTNVRTMWRKGKWKRGRTWRPGRTAAQKRAIVTLAEGEKIEIT